MKQIANYLSLMLLLTFLSTSAFAQKFGHLNSAQLLQQMPEVKSANAQLDAFEKQKMTKGEQMSKDLQTLYASYVKEAQEGNVQPIEQQKRENTLKAKQAELQKYGEQVEREVIGKREQLYQPIIDKVNNAIRAVGKELNYEFIFDTSMGSMLFVNNSNDVTALVKKKLGIL